jgi:multidrug transporter EmrE-like cation transporter
MKISFLIILTLIIITDLFDTISQLVLKSSINALNFQIDSFAKALRFLIRLARIPRVWISLLFSSFSLMLWLFVLSKTDLNLAYSMDSMRYVFITFASVAILKERVGAMRWFGIIAIISGIMLVSHG